MIYTSYYANYRNFRDMFRVSISRSAPIGSYDRKLIRLAPTADLLQKSKSNSITNEEYTSIYNNQLLSLESDGYIDQFIKDLSAIQGDVVLLCYEKTGKFCHRHLLAEWLNTNHHMNIREL